MTNSNPIAIIDCGTNTFHLMLAELSEKGAKILHAEKKPVKIGQGGIENRIITEEAQARALACIKAYASQIKTAGVTEVSAFATSAFRNARNGESLRDRIFEETGIHISIIPGDEEAGLIYDGVRYALDIGEAPGLIMDIGGGSVEFIIATQEEILWKRSFELGAQRLLDRFFDDDPIPQSSVIRMHLSLAEELKPLTEAISIHSPATLIGASGTFDTLSIMYQLAQGQLLDDSSPELPLTINGYYQLHEQLINSTREERLRMPGMVEMRVDMIVVASCLLDFVLKMSGIEKIRVSQYALKEGAMARMIKS